MSTIRGEAKIGKGGEWCMSTDKCHVVGNGKTMHLQAHGLMLRSFWGKSDAYNRDTYGEEEGGLAGQGLNQLLVSRASSTRLQKDFVTTRLV